jgi:hypothetical protein
MKQVLFTFDYELFLGKRSGTVSRCLIEPTERLLEIFGQRKLKMIFFVDTTYLLRLRELSLQSEAAMYDYNRVTAQVVQMVHRGHYVFPHLHPHWLDAKYIQKENQWDLSDVSRYRFHSLHAEERKKLFGDCMQLLRDLILPVQKGYKLDAYRAGGWCIQPFADFKPEFESHGIQFDFSVLKNSHLFSEPFQFDFRTVQSTPDIYPFSEDPLVPTAGGFREFTISMINEPGIVTSLMERTLVKVLPGNQKASYGDGYSVTRVANEPIDAPALRNEKKTRMASIELMNRLNLFRYLDFLKEHSYMHFISHPKMLSNHNFVNFEQFLKKVSSEFKLETDFKKMI